VVWSAVPMKVSLQLGVIFLLAQISLPQTREVTGHFYPEKKSYAVGEPVFVVLEMTNTTTEAIELDDGHCTLLTHFERLNGPRLENPGRGGIGGSCGSTIEPWQPGVTVRRRFLLRGPFKLNSPGEYSFRGHHTVFIRSFNGSPRITTEDIVTDFEIVLTAPADTKPLGK
jgi:hypothetical protein